MTLEPPAYDLASLRTLIGHTDVYLLDQILKGRFGEGGTLLDAGCGGGRNLVHFLRAGYMVSAVDREPEAVTAAKELARSMAPGMSLDGFRVAPLEDLPFADGAFDAVLASAVLHFARDTEHFDAMVEELWRVLAPGGFFFARLASTAGIEDQVQPLGDRTYHLPDGSDRFLVDEEMLAERNRRLGARPAEPLKTVLVHGRRSMTNWFLRKPGVA